MTDSKFDDRISEPEAAKRLGISRRTLRRWRKRDGDLAPPHFQYPSGTVRYPVDALQRWLDEYRQGANVDGRTGEEVA